MSRCPTFVLNPDNARARFAAAWKVACEFLQFDTPVKVTLQECKATRTLEQNSRLWLLLTAVAKQKQWPVDGDMQHLSPEDWKDIFTASLRRHQRVAKGIEGGFVMLGARTSRMSVGEMVELQDLIEAFMAEHDIALPEQTAPSAMVC